MRMLALLTWPYVRKHRLRSLLTLAGIVIGVAVFVGMHTANRNVGSAFARTVDRIAGKAQLQVSAGETGFPEETLEKVQSLREVGAAAPVIEAVLNTGREGQGNLLVLGVDMTGDRSLREYDLEDEDVIDDPLIFLAQPDSMIVSKQFAGRNGIERGGKLKLETMEGEKEFTVRGIMKAEGLAQAFGGNLAVMDIYAAQLVFGRGRMFDRIDIGLAEGVSVEECRKKLEALLGPGFQVETPSTRSGHFEAVSRALGITINITSLFALLIGVFIIYNSFSIAITERRSEIGILRALGASRGRVLGMFLGESLAAGLVGSSIGIWLGLLLGGAMTPVLGTMVQEVYGAPQAGEGSEAQWWLIAAALGIGMLASVAGGILPARAAARVDPVKALQKGQFQVIAAGENRMRRLVAFAMWAVALACLMGEGVTFYAGYLLMVTGVILLTPALAGWLARALRPALRWLRPVEGALAADSLIQAPRRTSATVAALMLSLALAVGFAGITRATYGSLLRWMNDTLNPDLFVWPTESITSRTFRFPASVEKELSEIEGIEEVQGVRNARVLIGGLPAMAISVSIEISSRRVPVMAVEGDPKEMLPLAAAGKGVIIADNLSRLRGLHKGDMLELDTPSGRTRLPILGVTVDYSDQQGAFLIDRSLYRKLWRDETLNGCRVYLKPGASEEKVKAEIVKRLGSHRRLFIFTNEAIREYILNITNQWFGLTYVQVAVALLVAVLGIVNTLTVSITDRRRELAILQAVGGLRRQVRHTIWLEAAAIGFIGLVLGLAVGAVTLYYNLEMLKRDAIGLLLPFEYPYGFAAALLPVILLVSFVAALWPGEAAVRASLVESLEYE
ncbi:MAG: FtsX-like permease family protein [Acidimicrobiia bacterium]|nr:FtsX-like permease family protein [Acidimicrobiia bacterium]